MDKPLPLKGITNKLVPTARLEQNVYFSGAESDIPVIFLHGNFSAALYWEETMLALPAGYRGIAPDLRGYGWTEDKLVDSTRGLRDLSDDVAALMDALKIEKAHFVGWSMGAGVLYRFITDYPGRAFSLTLICPVSPYGFGGTRDLAGTPCYDDFAGCGGGVVNPEFIRRIKEGDRSAARDPRRALRLLRLNLHRLPKLLPPEHRPQPRPSLHALIRLIVRIVRVRGLEDVATIRGLGDQAQEVLVLPGFLAFDDDRGPGDGAGSLRVDPFQQ